MGRILINEGEQLTEALINVLKKRGFVEIEVRPDESHRKETEALERTVEKRYTDKVHYDADVAKLKEEIAARFHNIPDADGPMQVIRVMTQKVLIDRLVKSKGLS